MSDSTNDPIIEMIKVLLPMVFGGGDGKKKNADRAEIASSVAPQSSRQLPTVQQDPVSRVSERASGKSSMQQTMDYLSGILPNSQRDFGQTVISPSQRQWNHGFTPNMDVNMWDPRMFQTNPLREAMKHGMRPELYSGPYVRDVPAENAAYNKHYANLAAFVAGLAGDPLNSLPSRPSPSGPRPRLESWPPPKGTDLGTGARP